MVNRYRIIMFFLSLSLMSFFVNYMISTGLNLSYLQIDVQKLMNNLSGDRTSLWLYTILQRLRQFLVLIILMKLFPVSYVLSCLFILLGGFIGTLFSVETFYDGFSGILRTILCFFPHYIFYFINVKMLSEYYSQSDQKIKYESFDMKKISNFAANIFIFLCGLASEVIINQIFLKNYFQYLVER